MADYRAPHLDFCNLPSCDHVETCYLPNFSPITMQDVDEDFVHSMDQIAELAENNELMIDLLDDSVGDTFLSGLLHPGPVHRSPRLMATPNRQQGPEGMPLTSPRRSLLHTAACPTSMGVAAMQGPRLVLPEASLALAPDQAQEPVASAATEPSQHSYFEEYARGKRVGAGQGPPQAAHGADAFPWDFYRQCAALQQQGIDIAPLLKSLQSTQGLEDWFRLPADSQSQPAAWSEGASAFLLPPPAGTTGASHGAHPAQFQPPASAPWAPLGAHTAAMDPPAAGPSSVEMAAQRAPTYPHAEGLDGLLAGWGNSDAMAALLGASQQEGHRLGAYKQMGMASAVLGRPPSVELPAADDLNPIQPLLMSLLAPPTSQRSPQQQHRAALPCKPGPHPLAPRPPTLVLPHYGSISAGQEGLDAPQLNVHSRPRAPAAKVRRGSACADNRGADYAQEEVLRPQAHVQMGAAADLDDDGGWRDELLPPRIMLPPARRSGGPSSMCLAPCQPDTPSLPLRASGGFGMPAAEHSRSGSGSDLSTEEAHRQLSGGEEEEEDEDEEESGSMMSAPFALVGGVRREVTRSALREVYDYPINEAARRLGVGVTVLKKYCRKFNIPRWPYRKLKSMEKLIESVNEYHEQDPDMTSTVLAELTSFRDMIYEDPGIDLEARIKKLRQANFKLEYKQRQGRGARGGGGRRAASAKPAAAT